MSFDIVKFIRLEIRKSLNESQNILIPRRDKEEIRKMVPGVKGKIYAW